MGRKTEKIKFLKVLIPLNPPFHYSNIPIGAKPLSSSSTCRFEAKLRLARSHGLVLDRVGSVFFWKLQVDYFSFLSKSIHWLSIQC